MINLVGMGPGHPDLVTPDAIRVIQKAVTKIAFGRISETATRFTGGVIKANRLADILECIQNNSDVAVMASGDACFYGILDYLKNNDVSIDRVVPGITSFQYMMSKLQLSWHQASFFSLHGREQELGEIIKTPLSIVLTDRKNTPINISRKLKDLGCRGTIHAGFDLSYETEEIFRETIGSHIPGKSPLSTLVIQINTPLQK